MKEAYEVHRALELESERARFLPSFYADWWTGDPADDAAVESVRRRLGSAPPDWYRSLLKRTNGWRGFDQTVAFAGASGPLLEELERLLAEHSPPQPSHVFGWASDVFGLRFYWFDGPDLKRIRTGNAAGEVFETVDAEALFAARSDKLAPTVDGLREAEAAAASSDHPFGTLLETAAAWRRKGREMSGLRPEEGLLAAATPEEVRRTEERLERSFPPGYRQALLRHGGWLRGNEFFAGGADESTDRLVEAAKAARDRGELPESAVPFGMDGDELYVFTDSTADAEVHLLDGGSPSLGYESLEALLYAEIWYGLSKVEALTRHEASKTERSGVDPSVWLDSWLSARGDRELSEPQPLTVTTASALQDLVAALHRARVANGEPSDLGEPAAEDDIVEYEEWLGFRFPPSFREFLRQHDGWNGCPGEAEVTFTLLNVGDPGDVEGDARTSLEEAVFAHHHYADDPLPKTWEDAGPGDPEAPFLPCLVPFGSDFNGTLLLFDPHRERAGEMEVVQYSSEGDVEARFASFADLLERAARRL